MCLGEPLGDLPSQMEDLLGRQRAPLQELIEAGAFDQLHHHPVAVVGLDQVEDRHDRRVAQAGEGPRLAPQTLPALGALGLRAHVFEGDRPAEARIVAAVDLAHAPFAEQLFDSVDANVSFHGSPRLCPRRGPPAGRSSPEGRGPARADKVAA